MDIELELNKLPEAMRHLYSIIGKYANLRYHLLIYKLIKRGHVKKIDIINDTGLSESRIYQIISSMEKILNENR